MRRCLVLALYKTTKYSSLQLTPQLFMAFKCSQMAESSNFECPYFVWLRRSLGTFCLTLTWRYWEVRPIVVCWPPTRPNMPLQRRRKLHNPLASYGKILRRRAWPTIWDSVKIPRYSHKLMHRKRVTCELHDSYFRSMMIKHAIPRTAEVAYSVGQLWEEIEWA